MTEPISVTDAQRALDEKHEARMTALAALEAANAKVAALHERVRAGESVKPRDTADAQTEGDHAKIALEGAQERYEAAAAALHQAKVNDAVASHHEPGPLARVRVAQKALRDAARELHAAVAAYNARERRGFQKLVSLQVPGFTSPVAQPGTLNLAGIIANGVVAGCGGGQAIRGESAGGAQSFMNALGSYASASSADG